MRGAADASCAAASSATRRRPRIPLAGDGSRKTSAAFVRRSFHIIVLRSFLAAALGSFVAQGLGPGEFTVQPAHTGRNRGAR